MTDKPAGIYRKYKVERTDGKSAPGEKHHECSYFVIDLAHDDYAAPALRAYAKACRAELPELARDIEAILAARPCGCREAMCPHVGVLGREPEAPTEMAAQLMHDAEPGAPQPPALAVAASQAELQALYSIVGTLPKCHHTVAGVASCGRTATWRHSTTHLCDEHVVGTGPRRALDGTIVAPSAAYEGSEPYRELRYAPGVRQLDQALTLSARGV